MKDKKQGVSDLPGAGPSIEGFVRRHYGEILRYCAWHTPDRASAEDATQDTFLKFVRFSDRFVDTGKTRALLYRIAANTCVDLMRKKRMAALPEDMECEEPGFAHAEAVVDARTLMKELDAETQELLLLRFGQDLSFREIGDTTGIPMRTVQSRIRKALKTIQATAKGEKLHE